MFLVDVLCKSSSAHSINPTIPSRISSRLLSRLLILHVICGWSHPLCLYGNNSWIHNSGTDLSPELQICTFNCIWNGPSECFNGTSNSTFANLKSFALFSLHNQNYSSHSVSYFSETVTHPATQDSHPLFITFSWHIVNYEVLSDLQSKYILIKSTFFHPHCLNFSSNDATIISCPCGNLMDTSNWSLYSTFPPPLQSPIHLVVKDLSKMEIK